MAPRYPNGYPRRGEIYQVDFNPARGSEQAGIRPAVVVSDDAINRSAPVVIVAAMTTTMKSYPQNVPLPAGQPPKKAGTIMAAQLLTLNKDRLMRYRAVLTNDQIGQLDKALIVSVGLRRKGSSSYGS